MTQIGTAILIHMNEPTDLVYIDTYGLLGSNFYWHKYATHGLSKEDIVNAGLTDDRVQVSKRIISTLVAIDKELQKRGWRLYIKEGYRSEAVYKIVYERRVAKYGKEITDTILNITTMPHSTGMTVDVAIWDSESNKEIYMRKGDDGVPAFFVHFYRDIKDEESRRCQELQDYIATTMMSHGFRFASKREYFHFDYKPEIPENYFETK